MCGGPYARLALRDRQPSRVRDERHTIGHRSHKHSIIVGGPRDPVSLIPFDVSQGLVPGSDVREQSSHTKKVANHSDRNTETRPEGRQAVGDVLRVAVGDHAQN